VQKTPVPTVPVAVSGLFGSSFSRAHGAPMSRWSGRVRAPVTVRFGAPLPADHVDVPTLARELSRLGGQSIGDEACGSRPIEHAPRPGTLRTTRA
jgi:1-acyl-sn-glycerol-3-phosphate acyltransferase